MKSSTTMNRASDAPDANAVNVGNSASANRSADAVNAASTASASSTSHTWLTWLKWFMPLAIILLLEATIFNAPFWSTLQNSPQQVTLSAISGVEKSGDAWKVQDSNSVILEAKLPQKSLAINTLNISPTSAGSSNDATTGRSSLSAGNNYSVSVFVKDAANSTEFLPLGKKTITEGLQATHYVTIHPSGDVSTLRLQMNDMSNGSEFVLNSIVINPRTPFNFSILRVALLIFLIYGMMLFAPSRAMYRWKLDLKETKQKVILGIFIVATIIALFGISRLMLPGRTFGQHFALDGAIIHDDNQANYMANALINGHAYLDIDAPNWMKDLANPYDAWARAHMSQQTGQPTYWDYAYYNGHYYSYFGVLPIIAIFVPFKLITGHDLRTDYAVVLLAALFVCAAVFFLYRLLKKYFAQSTFGQYLLYSLFFIVSSSVITQVYYAKIYSLPILTSLVVTMAGLGCWLGAARVSGGEMAEKVEGAEKSGQSTAQTIKTTQTTKISKLQLILGAALLTLNLGGRPFFVLAVLLALPIFWPEIKQRLFFSVKGLGNTLCVIVPVLIIGALAMVWNYIRFGSFTNFGATYNLTGFDMVHRSYAWQRLPIGLLEYLAQPLNIQPNFPYIFQIDHPNGFMGQIIMEPYFGGFFAFAPAALLAFALIPMWKKKSIAGARGFLATNAGFAVLLIMMDALIVGINNRYHGDFAWLICIIAIVMNSAIVAEFADEKLGMVTQKIFYALVIVGVIVTLWNLVSTERYGALISNNATLYRMIESMFLPFS